MNSNELEKVKAALANGVDLAIAHAEQTHIGLAGYKPERHKAVDRELEEMREALAIAECATPCTGTTASAAGTAVQTLTGLRADCYDPEATVVDLQVAIEYGAALAEEARREAKEEIDRIELENHRLRAEVISMRTAGGDAVYQIASDHKPSGWSDVTKEEFDAHTNETWRKKRILLQPVAEAAAQADDGFTDPVETSRRLYPDWPEVCAAAPTAQPTPPDDERAMGG